MAKMEYKCERCGHVSTTKGNLIQHLKRNKECPSKYSLNTREELVSRLIRVSTKEKIHECDYCNIKFSTPQGKSQHKKICPRHPSKVVDTRINILEDTIKQLQASIALHSKDAVKTNENLKQNIEHVQSENEKLKLQIQMLQAKKNEDFYQNILEKHFNATHKRLQIGITDITTDDTHIEIKRWCNWRQAFAQLILYNSHDPKEKLHACFFGEYTQPAKDLAIAALKHQNIVCFELSQTHDVINMTNLEDNSQEVVWRIEEAV
jgi:hypothetical protein